MNDAGKQATRDGAPVVLSIIVVSYNTRDLTLACLRSVYEQTKDVSFELLVVENASKDGSGEAIEAEFPGVRLMVSPQNLGFAGANNLAARQAVGEYLLLLNPDTVVLDRAVEELVAFAKARPEAGIWGGRTRFPDGSLNPTSCWSKQTPWSVLCRATGLSTLFKRNSVFDPESYGSWERDSEREVDIVTGCFFLITRELWNRLGGFDPAFFMYGEEADLCLRAQALGCRPRVTPRATIVHYGGASEKVRADMLVRLMKAKGQLIRRHWSPAMAAYGVAMLQMWSWTRALAGRVLPVSANRRESAQAWGAVWKRRGEWAGRDALEKARC